MERVDAVVVGAGAVGLSIAHALSSRGVETIVLEQNAGIGEGVSSRNSEVVHAGLYYPTGSLKARLCVEGRRRLYPFLDRHGVSYEKCGKLVVATSSREEVGLNAILQQAEINGVEGLAMLSAADVKAMEPALETTRALWSPRERCL